MSFRPHSACVLSPLLAMILVGCAVTGRLSETPSPDDLASAQAAFEADGGSLSSTTMLVGAYLALDRLEEARAVVSAPRPEVAEQPSFVLLRGLAEERAGNVREAVESYQRYLRRVPYGPFAAEAAGRAERLSRTLLEERARQLVLSGATKRDSALVLVLPLVDESGGGAYSPIAAATSELLSADLSSSRSLRTVDRLQVMSVLRQRDADAEVARRVAEPIDLGGVLGAGTVVYGRVETIGTESVRISATVVTSKSDGSVSATDYDDQVATSSIAVIETRLALLVFKQLGVQLTRKQRDYFAQGPTRDWAAWIAFGEGVVGRDRGDYALAAERFQRAVDQDGSFEHARVEAARAGSVRDSSEPGGRLGWRAVQTGLQLDNLAVLRSESSLAPGPFPGGMAGRPRAVLSELLGQDVIGSGSILELIVTPDPTGGR
jgi:TolB-like protein